MQICRTIADTRQQLAAWRRADDTIALVPTMGNLHDGHLSLVEEAGRQADRVVVSIFVNPTQFGPDEDFDSYPRTWDEDCHQLRRMGTDLIFAPTADVMYPLGDNLTWVTVDQLGDHLCGANRPGHFRGVTTVVSKLFHVIWPDVAIFGEKDYQQLTIIRRMTEEMLFPTRIVGAPTWRDADGLAESSRNSYLTEDEREQAPQLQAALQQTRQAIVDGERDFRALEQELAANLNEQGFAVDYTAIARADTLAPATRQDRALVIAVAAHLGKPRLIDNVVVTLPDQTDRP